MKSLVLAVALVVGGCTGQVANETTTTSSATATTAVAGTASSETTISILPISSLSTDEIAVIGHSNSTTFVTYYRADSTRDLLASLRQGGQAANEWGDPLHPRFDDHWTELESEEPPGGYRAVWVFLGYMPSWQGTYATTDFQSWAGEIYDQVSTRFPAVECIWWSPMNTYFSTNPGDGDAADLIALDPWGTNPSSLATWKTTDIASEWSWEITRYAIAQGYADDYGPWINLVEALSDDDERHPSEPEGAEHGANVLLRFFEGNQHNWDSCANPAD